MALEPTLPSVRNSPPAHMSHSPGPPSDAPPSQEDLNLIISLLPELYRAADMSTFPATSLRFINRLIPSAHFSSYNEIEMTTGSARVFYEPDSFTDEAELHKPGLWTYRHQHPLMRLHEENRHLDVHKISDHLTTEELHNRDLYQQVLKKMRVEDTLSLSLQSSRNLKIFYAINGPAPFDERDRAVARVIRPHLIQAFENALEYTDARAMAVLSAHTFRGGSHGLIMTDFAGRIIHASEQASAHLSQARITDGEIIPVTATNENLPPRILAWLNRVGRAEGNNAPPLELEMPGSSLVFRAAVVDKHHWIIASQSQDARSITDVFRNAYQLSLRQADVLLWLSRGKSNADIASILHISDRTVAKHVEHIFGKLGVENRLAASRKAIELLGR